MSAVISSSQTPIAEVVVDASAWVSRVLTQDSNHVAARIWIDKHLLNDGRLIAPTLLVTEVASAIRRRTMQSALAQAAVNQLYVMPNVQLVPIDQELIDAATDLATNLGLRGADTLYVALAKRLGIPLVSFDKEQLIIPSGIISTIRP